jgi:glc operon protein GlcG
MNRKLDLDLAEARAGIEAMRAELIRRSLAAVVAVADSRGDLICLERLDNAPLPSIVVAANKAWTAAREKRTTKEIGAAVRSPESGFDVAYWGDSKMLGWAGGVPVFHDGVVVGAVAVSGLDLDSDEEMARIGLAAIQAILANR